MLKSVEKKKKLSFDELQEHMIVRTSQLENIFDTYMLLLNSTLLADGDVEGELVYFGDGKSTDYTKWFKTNATITPVYFDSAEYIDGVTFDE